MNANSCYYSVSILENNSNDSLQKLFLILFAAFNSSGGMDFVNDGEPYKLDSVLLKNEEPCDWRGIENDLQDLSKIIPDVCFCVVVEPAEANCGWGESRILFYNGKSVRQEPEIIYPRFSLNDFEYETSGKQPLTPEETEEVASISKRVAIGRWSANDIDRLRFLERQSEAMQDA